MFHREWKLRFCNTAFAIVTLVLKSECTVVLVKRATCVI